MTQTNSDDRKSPVTARRLTLLASIGALGATVLLTGPASFWQSAGGAVPASAAVASFACGIFLVSMTFLIMFESFEDALGGRPLTPACAGMRRKVVMFRAEAISSKLRREVFQVEVAKVMTLSAR
jgi:hypothetical protein